MFYAYLSTGESQRAVKLKKDIILILALLGFLGVPFFIFAIIFFASVPEST